MKNGRKKKRSKPPKKVEENKEVKKGVIQKDEEATKRSVLQSLVEAFSLSSIEEADIAYGYAGGDPDKASEILRKGLAYNSEDPFGSSSSSCSGGSSVVSSGLDLASTSGSSDGFVDPSYGDDVGCYKGGKQKKKVVAATGTVSTILGKKYVRRNCAKNNRLEYNGVVDNDEAEQFLECLGAAMIQKEEGEGEEDLEDRSSEMFLEKRRVKGRRREEEDDCHVAVITNCVKKI